jgi:hypothetical protein
MNHEQLQKAIFEKCLTDPAFRAEILADPQKAINKAFDVQFAQAVRVHLHVESEREVHFAIPPETMSIPLDDSALDAVSAGIKGATGGSTSGSSQYMVIRNPNIVPVLC